LIAGAVAMNGNFGAVWEALDLQRMRFEAGVLGSESVVCVEILRDVL